MSGSQCRERANASHVFPVQGNKKGTQSVPSMRGEGEIRTPDTASGITVFETAAFDHSATSPGVR